VKVPRRGRPRNWSLEAAVQRIASLYSRAYLHNRHRVAYSDDDVDALRAKGASSPRERRGSSDPDAARQARADLVTMADERIRLTTAVLNEVGKTVHRPGEKRSRLTDKQIEHANDRLSEGVRWASEMEAGLMGARGENPSGLPSTVTEAALDGKFGAPFDPTSPATEHEMVTAMRVAWIQSINAAGQGMEAIAEAYEAKGLPSYDERFEAGRAAIAVGDFDEATRQLCRALSARWPNSLHPATSGAGIDIRDVSATALLLVCARVGPARRVVDGKLRAFDFWNELRAYRSEHPELLLPGIGAGIDRALALVPPHTALRK